MITDAERRMLADCVERNRCDKLVEQYWNLVRDTVRRVFRMKGAPMDRDWREEVVQEVFFQLLDDNRRRLRLYKEGDDHSLARWIVVISTSVTLNFLRKKGFDAFMGHRGRMPLEEGMEAQADVETRVLHKVSLDSALQTISQVDRVVLRLHRFGMAAKDIAVVVDSTEAGVYNRISRIKKVLADYVEAR